MNAENKKRFEKLKVESGLNPKTHNVEAGDWIKNADRTGYDDAGAGSCWKEYWQIFTLHDFPTKCPFCGNTMNVGDIDGCHIKVDKKRSGMDSREWLEDNYIIPGHHDCNVSIETECQAKINISAVKAIKK